MPLSITFEQVLKGTGTTGNVITSDATTASIAVGRVVVFGFNRNPTSGTLNGVASASVSGGAIGSFTRLADAVRASASDVVLGAFVVTTTIPSGSTFSLTANATTANNRAAVFAVLPSTVTSVTADASSGVTAQGNNGTLSYGPNGSSASPSATTTGSTTAGSRAIFGAVAVGGTNTFAEAAGWTRVDEARTATGSSDRGVVLACMTDNTPAAKTFSGTMSTSTSWAATVAALPGTFTIAPAGGWTIGTLAM